MAFTQSFIIVPDFPVTFQPELSHTDFPWLWDERRDSRIGLLRRNGDVSRIQWFEAPRCFAFHFANAYDDGDLTVVDLPKHSRIFSPTRTARTKARRSWSGGRSIARPGD